MRNRERAVSAERSVGVGHNTPLLSEGRKAASAQACMPQQSRALAPQAKSSTVRHLLDRRPLKVSRSFARIVRVQNSRKQQVVGPRTVPRQQSSANYLQTGMSPV